MPFATGFGRGCGTEPDACPACGAGMATWTTAEADLPMDANCFICGASVTLIGGPDGSRRWVPRSGTITPASAVGPRRAAGLTTNEGSRRA